jgi:hypothetical protein
MTRKDYVALARTFRDELEYVDGTAVPQSRFELVRSTQYATVARLVERVSAVLATDNPRFDAERFERAAYSNHWDELAKRLDT